MKRLGVSVLFRYSYRVDLFLEKYKSFSRFLHVNGNEVILKYEKTVYDLLSRKNIEEWYDVNFYDINDNRIFLSHLVKTPEFGGKGKGSSLKIENREYESIKKQLSLLKGDRDSIPLRLANTVIEVSEIISTKGTVKSDFHLVDMTGAPIAWISHKKGHSPSHFNQWAGLTEPDILFDKETDDFIKEAQRIFRDKIPNATTCVRRINSDDIKKMAVYGTNVNSEYGVNNCNIVLQGNVNIIANGCVYEFNANHIVNNDDIPAGGYEPVYMISYKGDRSQFGIGGARFSITSINNRKITSFI